MSEPASPEVLTPLIITERQRNTVTAALQNSEIVVALLRQENVKLQQIVVETAKQLAVAHARILELEQGDSDSA